MRAKATRRRIPPDKASGRFANASAGKPIARSASAACVFAPLGSTASTLPRAVNQGSSRSS